jgi:hypothetical protein
MMILLVVFLCGPVSAWKQDRFLVTFWCPPPATDEALARVASEGYNLTWSPADKLDIVAKYKLKALLQDDLLTPSSLDDPVRKAKLAALLEKVKNHPAMEGYFLADEPGSGSFPDFGRLVAFIKAHDPNHFAYINLLPTYASEEQLGVSADSAEKEKVGIPSNFAGTGDAKRCMLAYGGYLKKFVTTVNPELISYDHYHFLKNGVDGGQYFLNLGLVREASQESGLPFLNIIQASTIEPAWRLVNKNELRWLTFTTIAYGGRGISYFLYWGPAAYGGLYQDGKQTPLALDVAEINSELKTIGPEMMKLHSIAVYQTAPVPTGGVAIPDNSEIKIGGGEFVIGLFGRSAKKVDTFMIVNRDYKQPSTATILLPGNVRALKEFNRKSGKWESLPSAVVNHSVAIDLQPGDGRLLKMTFAR